MNMGKSLYPLCDVSISHNIKYFLNCNLSIQNFQTDMTRSDNSSRSSKSHQSSKAPQHEPTNPKQRTNNTAPNSNSKPSPKLNPSNNDLNTVKSSRQSRFREMAEIAGAATVGSTMGHVVGQSIVGVFQRIFGSAQAPADASNNNNNNACQFELSKFLECYNSNKTEEDKMQNCNQLFDRLQECKDFYRQGK